MSRDNDPRLEAAFREIPPNAIAAVIERLNQTVLKEFDAISREWRIDQRISLALLRAMTDAIQRSCTAEERRMIWRMQRDEGNKLKALVVPVGGHKPNILQ